LKCLKFEVESYFSPHKPAKQKPILAKAQVSTFIF